MDVVMTEVMNQGADNKNTFSSDLYRGQAYEVGEAPWLWSKLS